MTKDECNFFFHCIFKEGDIHKCRLSTVKRQPELILSPMHQVTTLRLIPISISASSLNLELELYFSCTFDLLSVSASKMPPDRGRASRACTSCRKQKTRCYEPGIPGRACLRCDRLRQSCSLVRIDMSDEESVVPAPATGTDARYV